MTERIDHAQKARDALAELDVTEPGATNLPADWCGATDDEQWLVHATLEEAQVHATLALVEQQRIANLISLGAYQNADGSRPAQHIVTYPINDYTVAINANIREALGLS